MMVVNEQNTHRVVVGIDGSPSSRAAADVAAQEAAIRRVPLHLVCAYSVYAEDVLPESVGLVPMLPGSMDTPVPPHHGKAYAHASEVLSGIVDDLQAVYPTLEIVSHAAIGQPAPVLIAESHRADMVVVGTRGHGGFAELLVGSVATQVATHAACPVVVVRGAAHPTGPVIAGVDTSRQAETVLGFAFAEADWHGRSLRVIHTWSPVVNEATYKDTVRQQEELELAEALAGWGERYPHISAERILVEADAVTALVEASEQASLVVVGSRGRGRFTSLLLGSVSYAVTHHAHCPVAIVRVPA
jgi:nucleotide-binding universal stress UspA family protein